MASASLFDAIHAAISNKDALFMETVEGTSVSYGDMLKQSAQYAEALTALGVKPGDRVAAQVEKSAANIMLYLGALRAGAVYLPLNTAYTPNELDYFLGDAEPTVFVCDPSKAEALTPIARGRGVAHLETLDGSGRGSMADKAAVAEESFADMPRAGDDLAAILYTSGTTGRSKGAMLTHDNLRSNAAVLQKTWRFTHEDTLLHALPVFHTHGLFVAINVTLLSNASLLFLPGFHADQMVERLPRATAMMGVPTFYTRLLARPELDRELTKNMRLFVSGSAPLSAETHKEWRERTGHAILERYGMTETNMSTSNPYDGERRAGTVGFPLEGVELRITDPKTGAPLPQGEVGVIEVRGPNVFKGYWRNPEKTAADFRDDGFFISGDLALIDGEGYVRIVGRDKDLIISGGFNVYPAEVESAIDALEGVGESAVIGVPHPDFGEGVTAIVIPKPGASLDENTIRAALAEDLAKYKVPKRVFLVESLPRNAMGKIQKNVLREDYKGLFSA